MGLREEESRGSLLDEIMRCSFKPYEGDEKYIFVSYSHLNGDTVFPILERLNSVGFRIWYDEGIEWGTEWPESIASHLRGCEICMVFHSKASIISQNCRQEINYALKTKKAILSVYLEDVELSDGLDMQLSPFQATFPFQYENPDDFFSRLIKANILQPCKRNHDLHMSSVFNEGVKSGNDSHGKTKFWENAKQYGSEVSGTILQAVIEEGIGGTQCKSPDKCLFDSIVEVSSSNEREVNDQTNELPIGDRAKKEKKKRLLIIAVIVIMIIAVCAAFLNKNGLSGSKEGNENESEVSRQVEPVNGGGEMETTAASENTQDRVGYNISEREQKDTFIKYTDSDLSVRALPQHNSDLEGIIENFHTKLYYFGETAQGYGSDNVFHTWYKIAADNGVSGWVRSDLVISQDTNVAYPYESDNEGTDYFKFTDDALNIRSEPSHDSSLVGQIADCNTYIHGCYADLTRSQLGTGSDGQLYSWIKVVVNSKLEGWVREDLLIPVASEVWYDNIFIKSTTTPLNVRALPQYDSTLVMSVKNADTKMYYNGVCKQGLGSDGVMHDWYQVEISNTEQGWVRSDLVKATINH